jgi:hypothetical protein
MARGIAVGGDGVTIDGVTFSGAIGVAVEVTGMKAVVRSSHFDGVTGSGVRLEQNGAALRRNVFRSSGAAASPAVQAVGGVMAEFDNNTFVHFPHVVEPEARADSLLGHENFVFPPAARR